MSVIFEEFIFQRDIECAPIYTQNLCLQSSASVLEKLMIKYDSGESET